MFTEARKKTVFRDSITGRFVAESDAQRRRATTEKQQIWVAVVTRKPSTVVSKKGGAS